MHVKNIRVVLLAVGLILTITMLGLELTGVAAQPIAASLTPRPTSVSWKPTPDLPSTSKKTSGGVIRLDVDFAPRWAFSDAHWQELWTVVQWQDALGNWHDVEGWQGSLDGVVGSSGWKVWWFSEDLFGRGPFRWLMYRSQNGELIFQSNEFHLPQHGYQFLVARVTVEP